MSVRERSELCAKDDLRAAGVDDVELKASADSVGERRTRRRKRSVAKDTVQVVKEDMNTRNWSVLRHLLIPLPKEKNKPSLPLLPSMRMMQTPLNITHLPVPLPTLRPKKRYASQSTQEREASKAKRARKDEEFLDDFDPHSDWLPPNTTSHDYTPEFCLNLD